MEEEGGLLLTVEWQVQLVNLEKIVDLDFSFSNCHLKIINEW